MAENQWYYARGGQQQGPVSLDQLRQMAATRQIAPGDLVWRDGMANWLPLNSVPEFSGQPASAAPQPAYGGAPQYGQPPYQPVGYGGYQSGYQQAGGQSYKGQAITSFVLSLLGLFCCGVVFGTIAISLGVTAQNGMKRSGNYEGKGLATAGLIIGIIDLIGWAVYLAWSISTGHRAFPRFP